MTSSRADVLPHGVRMEPLATSVDAAGRELALFDPASGALGEPLVYMHAFTVLAGRAKGWGRHEHHDDRYALIAGSVEIALCDMRVDSPTFRAAVIVPVHDADRILLVIPRGVWHATRNVGTSEAIIVDCPTQPYLHAEPDKFTLPLDTDQLSIRLGSDWSGH